MCNIRDMNATIRHMQAKMLDFLLDLSDKYAQVENPKWRQHSWDHTNKYTKIIHDKYDELYASCSS